MILEAPRKFAGIFTRTSHYYRLARDIEKRVGRLPVPEQQKLCLGWSREALRVIDLKVEVRGVLREVTRPCIYVGNHLSYLDIPLLMAHAPVVFVAKEEVSKWPIIGPAGKRAGTVFVKRESSTSRAGAAQAVAEAVLVHKQSVAIFPSGTTSMTESKPWRTGAFKIAHEHQILVQPFRLRYTPAREVAFIDDDMLAPHLWKMLRRGPLRAVLEFGEPTMIHDPLADSERLWQWAREIVMPNLEIQS